MKLEFWMNIECHVWHGRFKRKNIKGMDNLFEDQEIDTNCSQDMLILLLLSPTDMLEPLEPILLCIRWCKIGVWSA